MSRYDTEEEQVEAIKGWWKKNGTQLLTLLLVGVIAISGWRYWTNAQYVGSANSSSLFEALQANMQRGTFGEVSREALKLIQDEPDSPYAVSAAMMSAKYSLDKGEVEEALAQYSWISEQAQDAQLRNIAYLNLARIQMDLKKFDEAQKQLDFLAKANLKGAEKSVLDYTSGLLAIAQANPEGALVAFKRVVENEKTESNLLGLAQVQLDDLTH
ncbi:MAG: tetratricopeptide repeat protein [Thiomicrorhabdus sp.]|nr:tetratricopeptide repeat protein [Thiomicrorhabdus sp.]